MDTELKTFTLAQQVQKLLKRCDDLEAENRKLKYTLDEVERIASQPRRGLLK